MIVGPIPVCCVVSSGLLEAANLPCIMMRMMVLYIIVVYSAVEVRQFHISCFGLCELPLYTQIFCWAQCYLIEVHVASYHCQCPLGYLVHILFC